MKKFQKVICFVLMILCVIGAIGGVGYTLFYGLYPVSIGVAVLAYTAWPKFREYVIGLTL